MNRTPASGLLLGLALLVLPAAAADAPPREFWLYFAAFGNDRGELLDPADYAAIDAAERHLADPADAPAYDTALPSDPGSTPAEEVKTP